MQSMIEIKFHFLAVMMAVSLFGAMTPELTIIICALVGSVVAIVYNLNFIKDNKAVGGSFAIASFALPVIMIQTLLDYSEWFLKVANITACIFGLLSFQLVRYFMENSNTMVGKLSDAILNRAVRTIDRSKEKEQTRVVEDEQ